MDETKPGERPDTVHLQNLPCKFFNIGDNIRPSEGKLEFSYDFGPVNVFPLFFRYLETRFWQIW